VFSHIKNLPELCTRLREALDGDEVCAVGVSSRPRSVEGSYMPCFLSGVAAANAFAAAADAPVFDFSHQDGHVRAAVYSAGCYDKLIGKPFLAFHVSGGTTEVLLAKPSADFFTLTLIGETADLNAGQVIDRTGVMLGIPFPCGPKLEEAASLYEGKIENCKITVRENENTGRIECNLSGVENRTAKMLAEGRTKEEIAAFVFEFVGKTIFSMAKKAVEKYGNMPIIFAGGVMSNKLMRKRLSENFEAYFAEPAFSADNAAGIALFCREKFLTDKKQGSVTQED
jgi:N6-L-threonylcarbamoyladenine synthase